MITPHRTQLLLHQTLDDTVARIKTMDLRRWAYGRATAEWELVLEQVGGTGADGVLCAVQDGEPGGSFASVASGVESTDGRHRLTITAGREGLADHLTITLVKLGSNTIWDARLEISGAGFEIIT